MLRRWIALGTALTLGTLGGGAARADELGCCFAGRVLEQLRWASRVGMVEFQSMALVRLVNGSGADLIMISAGDHQTIRYVVAGDTQVEVLAPPSPSDVKVLEDFCKNSVVRTVREFKSERSRAGDGAAQAKLTKLMNEVRAVPDEKREATRRLLGAELAGVPGLNDEAKSWVQSYRQFAESRAERSLRDNEIGVRDWLPYVSAETNPATLGDLLTIDPETVGSFRVDGKDFKKGWSGPSLIVVPQGKEPSGKTATKIEGLKQLQVDSALERNLLDADGQRFAVTPVSPKATLPNLPGLGDPL